MNMRGCGPRHARCCNSISLPHHSDRGCAEG